MSYAWALKSHTVTLDYHIRTLEPLRPAVKISGKPKGHGFYVRNFGSGHKITPR